MQEKEQDQEFSFKRLFVPLTTLKVIHWIIIIGFLVFGNALFNGFIGDDVAQVVNNTIVHSIGNFSKFFTGSTFSDGSNGLTGLYYKPILSLTYSLIYTFFKDWSPAFHFFQLGIHVTNAILIFLFCRKMLKKEIAFGISILFLIHPINNESVVSIAALQEPLFLFFGLLTLKISQRKISSYYSTIMIIIFLVCSLLSKETGFIFFLIIPLYQKLFQNFWKAGAIQSGIALLIYFILRIGIAHIFLFQQKIVEVPIMKLSLLERFFNIPIIIFFYFKTFFFPQNLIISQRWVIKSMDFQNFYVPLVVDVVIFVFLLILASSIFTRVKRHFKTFLFFFSWFILGLGFHLQIIPLDYTVSDRWFYFPIIGLLGMAGVVVDSWISNRERNKRIYFIILIIVVSIFSVRDMIRNTNWKDAFTLYQHDVKLDPNNYSLQSNLGIEFYNKGNLQEAKSHVLYSVKLFPSNQNLTILGLIYAKSHQIKDAEMILNKALAFNDSYFTYVSLARIMVANEEPKTTIVFLKRFLSKFPNDALPWLYLAVEEYKMGNKDTALSDVRRSYEILPSEESIYIYNSIINNQPIKLIGN